VNEVDENAMVAVLLRWFELEFGGQSIEQVDAVEGVSVVCRNQWLMPVTDSS
jgi:hypothetical protein